MSGDSGGYVTAVQPTASEMPILRHTSSTGVPTPAYFRANAICTWVNFDFFTA